MLGAVLLAAPAQAQISQDQKAYFRDSAVPSTFVYPGPDKAVLLVDVKASVGGVCGFAPGNEPNAIITRSNIDTTAWSAPVPFTAQCTAPWRIAISSRNGALQNSAPVPAGYQNRAPYAVTLNVRYDTGSSAGAVTSTCPVAQIDQASSSTACNFKGTASTTNGLQVPRSFNLTGSYIQVAAPAYPGPDILVEGTYTDVLTVTVSPGV